MCACVFVLVFFFVFGHEPNRNVEHNTFFFFFFFFAFGHEPNRNVEHNTFFASNGNLEKILA